MVPLLVSTDSRNRAAARLVRGICRRATPKYCTFLSSLQDRGAMAERQPCRHRTG